ncbi:hypothetical protein F511_07644 [Dorcoceras hygrometricum]|uniref:Uncharacterized protein n=1 Tax=Dorcoceras hygrometricum TaxID=472368 RepID=A0A2Z7CJC5_9LAMI|nr:hypothetical protein F511_07644 [Dorcoceras hygrometricum]
MDLQIGSILLKVALFIIVQALVFFILSKSSNVFSKTQRTHSFKTARSLSIRRWAAALADIPAGSELSPSTRAAGFLRSFSRKG